MEKIKGIETKYGLLEGRDRIYLDLIECPNETQLKLIGELNIDPDFKKYEIQFDGIVFYSSIELDFDIRGYKVSFGVIQNSELIREFQNIDHSNKLNSNHKHFYFRTYDSVFEIIAEKFNLKTH